MNLMKQPYLYVSRYQETRMVMIWWSIVSQELII